MTPVIEDRTAAHQIAIISEHHDLAVTCSCLAPPARRERRPRYRQVIDVRRRFPAAEARAVWQAWHEKKGIEL